MKKVENHFLGASRGLTPISFYSYCFCFIVFGTYSILVEGFSSQFVINVWISLLQDDALVCGLNAFKKGVDRLTVTDYEP